MKVEEIEKELKTFLNPKILEFDGVYNDRLFLIRKSYNFIVDDVDSGVFSNLETLQSILDITWEDLNIGHWSLIPEGFRKLYGLATLLKVIILLKIYKIEQQTERLKEAVKSSDLGLILGCGFHKELTTAATLISSAIYEISPSVSQDFKLDLKSSSEIKFPGIEGEQIKCVKRPSLEYFSNNHFSPRIPLKMTDCISHWPAFSKWNDIEYLKKVAGARTVPIEIGSSYTESDWGMRLTTIQEFIENHIMKKSGSVGYLAQHQLFDQIPELKDDIRIPDYCCVSDSDDFEVDTNAWFGPAGTITPIHYDPKHNLFCQIVGSKRVILYDPEDSENLYAHDVTMLKNTAQVDPYNPDYDTYPKFKSAKAFECIMHPGDMLYIPPKWWHHVKSLDVSFSVSFWWE